MTHRKEKTPTLKGKLTSGKNGALSLLLVPHKGKMKTVRLLHYKGLFFMLAIAVLVSGTVAIYTAIRISAENISLRQNLNDDAELYNESLDNLNALLADQAALLKETNNTLSGYETGTALSAKTLDNYKSEYENMVVAYIDKNVKAVNVSRGENGNSSFKSDVATLKSLLETAENAALEADASKSALAQKTEKLKSYVSSLPSFWPTTPGAEISSDFGRRFHPVFHFYKKHEGLDIGDKKGAPIYAAGAGTVVSAEWHSGYGNLVEIDHGNGYSTRYGHCSKLLVTVGQKVSQGEKIALTGSTGTATGPHLHFEVRVNGTTVNPEMFITP